MALPRQALGLSDVKESSGSSLYQSRMKLWNQSLLQDVSPTASYGSRVNVNRAYSLATFTTKSASPSPRKSLLPLLQACLEPESTPNSRDPMLLPPTVPKKKPGMVNPFLLDRDLSDETQESTGMPCGRAPSPEISCQSRVMSEWYLIVPSEPLGLTTQSLRFLKRELTCFGELQVTV